MHLQKQIDQIIGVNSVLNDIRAIGYIIYTLIGGESPWQGRIGKRIVEKASIGYVSFTNPLWKKITQESEKFVKRLIKPKKTSETYELLLNDPFILNYSKAGAKKIDLFADNVLKIKKLYLHRALENLVYAIKLRRHQQKKFQAFQNLIQQEIRHQSKILEKDNKNQRVPILNLQMSDGLENES